METVKVQFCAYCGRSMGDHPSFRRITVDKLPEKQTLTEKGYTVILPACADCLRPPAGGPSPMTLDRVSVPGEDAEVASRPSAAHPEDDDA